MSEHVDIFSLLRGELSNAETIAAGAHLETCEACREELAEAVVGHALLTRASGALGAHHDLTPAAPAPSPRAARRRLRPQLLLTLAAAVVLIAGLIGAGAWLVRDTSTSSPTPQPDDDLRAALLPVDGTGTGEVSMAEHDGRTRMTFSVHDLPSAGDQDYYYAWLLDPATNKMLPLGQVDADTGATFDLPDALVASYSAVDVSLETDDGDPAHSPTSVLRGTYEPSQITTNEREAG